MAFKRFSSYCDDLDLYIARVEFPEEMKSLLYEGVTLRECGTPKVYLKYTKGRARDVLTGGTSMPIVSAKVKAFLETSSEGDYCEFISLDMRLPKGVSEYFMLNILDPIPCFDFEKSEYQLANEDPRSLIDLKRMVIDQTKTRNRKIFYMYEYPVEIFVEDEFAEEMATHGIDSVRLLPLRGEV